MPRSKRQRENKCCSAQTLNHISTPSLIMFNVLTWEETASDVPLELLSEDKYWAEREPSFPPLLQQVSGGHTAPQLPSDNFL